MIRFLLGACVFRFLACAADRLLREEGVFAGRSRCGSKIPLRFFFAEALGGAVFAACGLRYGCGAWGLISLRGAVVFAYIGILLMVARIDWEIQIIYDRFHILIFALGCAAVFLFPEHGLMDRLTGAVVIAGPMLILTLIIPGAFGGGDIKLMAASGWLLGFVPIVVAAMLGIFTGGAYAAFMLARRRLARKDHFAFGPFLAFGLAAAALVGEEIAEWYLRFLV